MHDEVKQAIEKGKGSELRYFFVDSWNIDPTFASYKDDFDYCLKHNVFEPHKDITPLRNDESLWDKEYWFKLKVDIQKNFSEERMQHMIKVAKVVFKTQGEAIKNNMSSGAVDGERIYEIKRQDNKKLRIERLSPEDDPEKKQEKKIQMAREALKRENEINAKNESVNSLYNGSKYNGGRTLKKSKGVPLIPVIIGVIALIIILLILIR